MNNHSGNGKWSGRIALVANVFGILGISVIGLVLYFVNSPSDPGRGTKVVAEKESSSPSGSVTIKRVTATPKDTNSPKPKDDKKDPITPKKTKDKKTIGDNIIKVSSSPSTNPPTKTKKKKKENDEKDADKNKSNNAQTDKQTEPPVTEEPAYPDNKQDSPADQTSSTQVNIDSPGNLILTSKNKKKNSQVDISRVSEDDNSDESQDDAASFDYSEIVNDEGIENADEVVYLPVLPGTYIFVFHNCDFEDIDFYLADDVNNIIDGGDSEDNVIPSSDIFQIDITNENPSADFTVKADRDFTPVIKFYSKEDVKNAGNISLVISDSEGHELQVVQLNQKSESGTKDIAEDFNFVEGQEYSLEIQAGADQEIPDITCCLEIGEYNSEK